MSRAVSRAVTMMLDCEVENRDIQPSNVLWNAKAKKLMLADFELWEIMKQAPILQKI